MQKIYIFSNGGSSQWYEAMALCEDGACIVTHICSSVGWMPHDMGITSTCKHEYYDKHCGVGNWELVWVDNAKTHLGVQAAYALNQAMTRVTA